MRTGGSGSHLTWTVGAVAALLIALAAASDYLDIRRHDKPPILIASATLKHAIPALAWNPNVRVAYGPAPSWLTPQLCKEIQTLRDLQEESERQAKPGKHRCGPHTPCPQRFVVPESFPQVDHLYPGTCEVSLPKDANEIVKVPGGWLVPADCGELGQALYAVDTKGHARVVVARALFDLQGEGREGRLLGLSPAVIHMGFPTCGSVWEIQTEGGIAKAEAKGVATLPMPALRMRPLPDGGVVVLGRARQPLPAFFLDRKRGDLWEVICEAETAVKMNVVPSRSPIPYDMCEGALSAVTEGRELEPREFCTITEDVAYCASGVGRGGERATVEVLVGIENRIQKTAPVEPIEGASLAECLVRRLPGANVTRCALTPGIHKIEFVVRKG